MSRADGAQLASTFWVFSFVDFVVIILVVSSFVRIHRLPLLGGRMSESLHALKPALSQAPPLGTIASKAYA